MIDFSTIYSDLNIPPYVKQMFNDRGVNNPWDICLALEVYKYVTREDLCSYLTKKMKVQVDSVDTATYLITLDVEFINIGAKYDVLIDKINSIQVRVISSVFNSDNADKSLVSINQTRTDVVYVTPLNYLELSGAEFQSWDYLLLFARLVQEGVEKKATDLHVGVRHIDKKPSYFVAYRIEGQFVRSDLFKFNARMNEEFVRKVIHHRSEAVVKDLNTIYGVVTSISDIFNDGTTSVRLTGDKIFGGYRCVCRIQKISTVTLKVHELGFPESIQDDLQEVSRRTYGLSLVGGPINTGKNTTVFSIANEIMEDPINIVDLSSPIEVLLPCVQIDYMSDIDYLVERVRLLKKQDVNLVLLNEIPDKKVAAAVLDLVNSSVHVITTTHIPRLHRLPYKLQEYYGDSYKSVISQLNFAAVQKMTIQSCQTCKREASFEKVKPRYRQLLEKYGYYKHYINDGCENCRRLGHTGKLQPFMERLVFDEDIVSELLAASMPHDMERIIKSRLQDNGQSLEHEMTYAVSSGLISVDHLNLL